MNREGNRDWSQRSARSTVGILPYVYPLALGLAVLPFMRAFTLEVGFPLKIYEPILSLAAMLFVIGLPRVSSFVKRKFIVPLIGLLAAATIGYTLMIYSGPVTTINVRGGPVLDGLSRICYLALNIIVFIMCAQARDLAIRLLANSWLVGTFLAASYVIFTQLIVLAYGDAPLLPGLERHQLGSVGPIQITRSGLFEEGNFAGLYFLLSIAIALHFRNFVVTVFAAIGLVLSLSTAAYFGMIAGGLAYFLLRKNLIGALPYVMAAGVALFGVFTFFAGTGKFAIANSSAAARLNEIMTAFHMFLDTPWFGVGLGQYGFLYYFYEWDPSAGALSYTERHIVNNIYGEILVETGIIGLSIFALLIINWIRTLYSNRDVALVYLSAAIGMLVCWLAYPTFNIAFIWAFMGLTIGSVASAVRRSVRPAGGPGLLKDGRSGARSPQVRAR